MTRDERAGLARLMLRWPDRRLELVRASRTRLLESFEAYELACDAAAAWSKRSDLIADEYLQLIAELELEISANL